MSLLRLNRAGDFLDLCPSPMVDGFTNLTLSNGAFWSINKFLPVLPVWVALMVGDLVGDVGSMDGFC